MDLTIFHNAEAGEQEWPRDRVLSLCRDLKLNATYLDAKDPASLRALATVTGPVAVVGGDGTISKAVSRLDRTAAKMLIVPTGGANNVARSLGVFTDPASAFRSFGGADCVSLHVGKLAAENLTRQFVEGVGLGALVSLVSAKGQHEDSQTKRKAGQQRVIEALAEAKALRSRIVIDGEMLDQPVLAFEASNIAMIGPNLPLALHVAKPPRHMVACWLLEEHRAAMHKWLQDPDPEHSPMKAIAARRIEIEIEGHSLRVDDKLCEASGTIRMRLRRRPLDVLVPKVLP
ncbi:hypothetical protein GXW78_04215 [Roseomonas terrae]|jgi:diacylglycerol kinase (ATP)|uniref:DAGKc domain-containing protein n=1 Tax=Neoroseomonas terrae TaxID=424799 RepID=A0ABS5ECV6_9PROT|nr:diacylglycerol kinase family protein [Neoroseomonas terrae]MBR0648853.1 hypothetical protein [Neoroseomonas terrae]